MIQVPKNNRFRKTSRLGYENPNLSLVDREVELCTNDLYSFFSYSVRIIPFAGIELTFLRVRGYMVPLSYRGDRHRCVQILF